MSTFHEVANQLEALRNNPETTEDDLANFVYEVISHLYDQKGYTSADDVRNLLGLAAFRDVDGICELLRSHEPNEEF